MGLLEAFGCALLSALIGYGLTIVVVEKRAQWPATAIRPCLSKFLSFFHGKLPGMLDCSTCFSFWAALLGDVYFLFYTNFAYVPMWPISGFLAVVITWTIIELMNAIDPKV